MMKRLASVLVGIAVIGVVAVSLASNHPDTVPIGPPGSSLAADCCCGGTVDGCTGDCDDCEADDGYDSDSCDCDADSCGRDLDDICGCDSDDDGCSVDLPDTGCGGCR
jgi:hypothetical protein